MHISLPMFWMEMPFYRRGSFLIKGHDISCSKGKGYSLWQVIHSFLSSTRRKMFIWVERTLLHLTFFVLANTEQKTYNCSHWTGVTCGRKSKANRAKYWLLDHQNCHVNLMKLLDYSIITHRSPSSFLGSGTHAKRQPLSSIPWRWVHPGKLTAVQPVKNSPEFYRIWKLIPLGRRIRHSSMSRTKWIKSTSNLFWRIHFKIIVK